PSGIPEGAMCVQRFDDSRNSAIHITYRISLRSSSMPEPRDPLLKVFDLFFFITQTTYFITRVQISLAGTGPRLVRKHNPSAVTAVTGPPKQVVKNTRVGRSGS